MYEKIDSVRMVNDVHFAYAQPRSLHPSTVRAVLYMLQLLREITRVC